MINQHRIPNFADLPLCLTLPGVDGIPVNPTALSWELELRTRGPRVRLSHTAGSASVASTGEIPCACTLEPGKIHLYIKSSVASFGEGHLVCRMQISLDSERFPGGEQLIRMIPARSGQPSGQFEIETNITII